MQPSVFIAMPAFGQINNSQTTSSLIALTKQLAELGIFGGFSALSFPDLVDLRNIFLTTWFDRVKSTHMLFVDADMQFEPELVRDMLLADKPLVGCLYPKKRLPITWVGSALDTPAEPEGNLLELEGLGCGVMLIRRDCVESMIASGQAEVEDDIEGTVLADILREHGVNRLIRAFDKIQIGKRHLSEDFSFCARHRNSGGKVFAVINHVLCHVGQHQYAARYSDLYERREAE